LFLHQRAHARPRLGDGRRCLRLHRPGVLLGRVPGHEQRRAGRGDGRRDPGRSFARSRRTPRHGPPPAPRAALLLVVHLPLHHAGHGASVRQPAQLLADGTGGHLDAGRRRVRQPRRALAPARVPHGLQPDCYRHGATRAGRLAAPPPPGPPELQRRHPAGRQSLSRPLPLPGSDARLEVSYAPAHTLQAQLDDPRTLAVFGFGDDAPASDDPRWLRVPLRPLQDQAVVEVWRAAGPVSHGRDGDVAWASDGRLLFGAMEVPEPEGDDIRAAAHHAYARMCGFIAGSQATHLLRVWNYMDAITLGEGDDERYRRFCVGRVEGLGQFEAGRLPAATAIGRCDRRRVLQAYWLAATGPGTPLENPRQVSAYRYPRQHGPQPPSFARAMLPPTGSDMPLLLSGTAAIVGHASQHAGSVRAQVDETMANIG